VTSYRSRNTEISYRPLRQTEVPHPSTVLLAKLPITRYCHVLDTIPTLRLLFAENSREPR